MKNKRLLSLFVLVLLALIVFTSCGSESDAKGSIRENADYGYGDGAPTEEASAPSKAFNEKNDSEYEEKIIRDVSITAQTKEFERTLTEIHREVQAVGGYIQSESTNGRSYGDSSYVARRAQMVLRIPAASLDAFLGKVGELINVTSESSNVSNVTAAYYDIQARIGVLEDERAAYEEMLRTAKDTSYILEIKDRLYNVIEEIESYKTQLKLLDSKVSYSTVTMRLEEVVEYSAQTTPRTGFGTRVVTAMKESWSNFGRGVQNFVVWLIYALPTLLVLALIVGVIVFALVLSSKRTKKRLAAKAKKEEEKK